MKRARETVVAVAIVALTAILAMASWRLQSVIAAQEGGSVQGPLFQVDPFWPKPLPNSWVLGSVVGLSVDARDHVWIVHRGASPGNLAPKEAGMLPGTNGTQQPGGSPPALPGDKRRISEICCDVAPPVLEFDPEGNLAGSWGGPGAGFEWPPSMHGVTVDGKDFVWLAGNQGNTVLKFSRQGSFLLQIGRNGQSKGNNDTANLGRPAEVDVDLGANEVYVADGYGNRRVIVFDASTGAYKRHWGAYGKKPDDTDPGPYDPGKPLPQVFWTVHCALQGADGLIYVCDRANDRIQVFRKDGTFVREAQLARQTLGDGSVFDMAFSKDTAQKYLLIADGANHRIWTLLREPLQVVSHFGRGGRQAGQFYSPHNVALDSKGNLYTVETYEGKRLQKFSYKGIGAVPAATSQ